MVIASFLICLCLFLGIGLYSMRFSQKTAEDYLIAGKSVPPWLVGLSAIATNNSGYMFIGMIGTTFAAGLQTIWIMLGWITGDLIASLLALRKLRQAADNERIHSFGGLLAHWYGGDQRGLRRIAGLATVFFLTLYAAAQLKAGSKATLILLDWDLSIGIIIGAVIVLAYSAAGGIRASIWTDAAQSFVMIFGMFLLVWAGISHLGGVDATMAALDQTTKAGSDLAYMSLMPHGPGWASGLYILGWIFGGAAVIGQPHVVIRFMSIDKPENINRMRFWYYGWFTFFYGATIIVGLLARLVIDVGAFDKETALPMMASELLHPTMVGLILAALFAATMSTADSLVLSCSAAVTRDFVLKDNHTAKGAKIATAVVLFLATIIALTGTESVFQMVLDAWGLLGAAFVPLIVALAIGYRVPQAVAIATVVVGIGTVLLIKTAGGLGALIYAEGIAGPYIYETGAGMLAGALVLVIGRLVVGQDETVSAAGLGRDSIGTSDDQGGLAETEPDNEPVR